MNKRFKKRYKEQRRNLVLEHIKENFNIYFIVLVLFLVGIFIGVIITNNLSENKSQYTKEYIDNTINLIKTGNKISRKQSLKHSVFKNFIIAITIWVLGLTFLGKYLLYLITLILGITFGYTISSIMSVFDFGKGLLFCFSTMLLHNIITIPTIIFLCMQGIKCHNELTKTKNNFNMKYFFIKFSSYTIVSMLLLLLSSVIEVYVSDSIVYGVIKYL